jgi:hypothetical protein
LSAKNLQRQIFFVLTFCNQSAGGLGVGIRLGALMDRISGVAFTPTFQRASRASAVPQQPLQAWAADVLDAHVGVGDKPPP